MNQDNKRHFLKKLISLMWHDHLSFINEIISMDTLDKVKYLYNDNKTSNIFFTKKEVVTNSDSIKLQTINVLIEANILYRYIRLCIVSYKKKLFTLKLDIVKLHNIQNRLHKKISRLSNQYQSISTNEELILSIKLENFIRDKIFKNKAKDNHYHVLLNKLEFVEFVLLKNISLQERGAFYKDKIIELT